jgi:hypothetical protein
MVEEYVKAKPGRCVVLVHGYVVDVTAGVPWRTCMSYSFSQDKACG